MKLSQYGTLATTSSYSLLESRNVTDMTLNLGCYGPRQTVSICATQEKNCCDDHDDLKEM